MSRISHVLLLHLFRLSDSSYIFIIMMAQLTNGLLFRFLAIVCAEHRNLFVWVRDKKSQRESKERVRLYFIPMKNAWVCLYDGYYSALDICHFPSFNKCKHRSYKPSHTTLARTHARTCIQIDECTKAHIFIIHNTHTIEIKSPWRIMSYVMRHIQITFVLTLSYSMYIYVPCIRWIALYSKERIVKKITRTHAHMVSVVHHMVELKGTHTHQLSLSTIRTNKITRRMKKECAWTEMWKKVR